MPAVRKIDRIGEYFVILRNAADTILCGYVKELYYYIQNCFHGYPRWWVCGGLYKSKKMYSGQSLSNGKDQVKV